KPMVNKSFPKKSYTILIIAILAKKEAVAELVLTNLNYLATPALLADVHRQIVSGTQVLQAASLGQTLIMIWSMCFYLIVPTLLLMKTDCLKAVRAKIFNK